MAVLRTGERKEEFFFYEGEFGDLPTTGVSIGTMATEVDTGAQYVFMNGTWEEDLRLIYAIQQAML